MVVPDLFRSVICFWSCLPLTSQLPPLFPNLPAGQLWDVVTLIPADDPGADAQTEAALIAHSSAATMLPVSQSSPLHQAEVSAPLHLNPPPCCSVFPGSITAASSASPGHQPSSGIPDPSIPSSPPKPNAPVSQEPPLDVFTRVSRGTSPKRPPVTPDAPLSEHPNSFDALNDAHILDVLQDVLQRENRPDTPHLNTSKHFYITFIYGHNHVSQRQPMWNALHQLSLSTPGDWGILGDFNTILYKNERMGGNEVTDHDIQELSNFKLNCEVQEMTSSGAFFTWTKKTIWSKLDHAFINNLWYEIFDFTLAKVLPPGLSNHFAILLQFHVPLRPPAQFQLCDMWSSHKDFQAIVSTNLPGNNTPDIMRQA
ncbi:hypothetical protein Cgig2_029237 [Carnegiea gigantea]|uniref:Uncharacterized protein n=1 Tax=Carnegiea gigantea TaxID=171969 RepID=A0A9Q1GWP7_9CARY|nr:hypothetical protein Cgig2_029237 [Carnegiea gigantea]